MVCPEPMSWMSDSPNLPLSDRETGLYALEPGETWTAPEVMVQILPTRELESGTALMNRYLNHRFPPYLKLLCRGTAELEILPGEEHGFSAEGKTKATELSYRFFKKHMIL